MANEYGVHENTIGKWRRLYMTNPEQAFQGQQREPPDETERMKRRIQELENEVDFLKKVSAYFAKNPR